MEWTGARYADKPTVEASAWIEAEPERVWQLVSDITVMPTLSSELQAVEWVEWADGADQPRVGAVFVGHNKHESIGEWSTRSQIVDCTRPREFAWAVGDPDDPAATWRFLLAPDGGGTTLTYRAQLGPGRSGLSQAIEAMPEREQTIVFVRLREWETAMTATLTGIKKLAEAH